MPGEASGLPSWVIEGEGDRAPLKLLIPEEVPGRLLLLLLPFATLLWTAIAVDCRISRSSTH